MIGIYRITNKKNNKLYIGLSKNIEQRWKTHTSNIKDNSEETVIRKAFAKYGLRQQVSKSGTYGNFIFEVIEECSEKQLHEREIFYIRKERPKYNIQVMPPNQELFLKNIANHEGEAFLQYHNFDTNLHFPAITVPNVDNTEPFFELYDKDADISEAGHVISTNKAMAGTIRGAKIYLIIGLGSAVGKSKKDYFLWSTTLVEDLEFFKDDDLKYNLFGEQEFMLPKLLNEEDGFDEFKKSLGNFAFGLSSIDNHPFLSTLESIEQKYYARRITHHDFLKKHIDFYDISIS